MRSVQCRHLSYVVILGYICWLVSVQANVIRPMPTPTPTYSTAIRKEGLLQPTTPPQFKALQRRDVVDNLSLYQNWASACQSQDTQDPKNALATNPAPSLNPVGLWKTITETVNCGNGYAKTVTKTVTTLGSSPSASATATATALSDQNGSVVCVDTCWSDYLWYTYGYGVSVAQGITGTLLMLLGIYFMFFGYRYFRPTLALVGFVFFATMTWIGLVNNEPPFGYVNNDIVYMCVSIGLGLVGAILFVFIYAFAIYFIGATGGLFLAVYILSWKASLVIQIEVARICFIVGVGVVMAILVFMLEIYSILFATAFMGGYLIILGLDLFIHTGFVNAWLFIFDKNPHHYITYLLNTPVYVMLSFVGFFTLVSFGWQYYWNIIKLQRYFGVNVIPLEAEKVATEEEDVEEKKEDTPSEHPSHHDHH